MVLILDQLIYLYELSGGGLPTTIRVCNWLQTDGTNVFLGGQEYNAIPVLSEGFDRELKESLPRPQVVVSNVSSDISALVRDYGLVRSNLRRIIIPQNNLDGGSSPDPNGVIKIEDYIITHIEWNNQTATLNLRSPLDLENLKIPRRTVGSVLND